MKFLEWNGEQYVRNADVLSWLTRFAEDLESGVHGEDNKVHAAVMWNVVATLMEGDLRSIDGVPPC